LNSKYWAANHSGAKLFPEPDFKSFIFDKPNQNQMETATNKRSLRMVKNSI